jgi:hypothetical protein
MRRQGSGARRQEGIKNLPAPSIGAYDGPMADIWVLLTIVGFFALCVGLVWGCDRIIGPDDASDPAIDDGDAVDELVGIGR